MPLYAIKTGRRYTLVTVHDNQCSVRLKDGDGCLFVTGTSEKAIRQAARDGAGESFKTLKAAREARLGQAFVRRPDLDC
jgi:hypothetical protein